MNEEIYKSTLSKPVSQQSKTLKKNFNPVLKQVDKLKQPVDEVDGYQSLSEEELNEIDMLLNEREVSLKKKIFNLDKMKGLVFSDPKLSAVFDEMAINGGERYGYHWRETVMNIIFNDYVLNSAKYLQKYKAALPAHSERRDASGINQLKKAGMKKMGKTGTIIKEPDLEKKVEPVVDETTGAASSGSFAQPMGMQNKNVGIAETTTASSAGGSAGYVGYAGPAAWSKKGDLSGDFKKNANKHIIDKPMYIGGTIVGETKNNNGDNNKKNISENVGNYLIDPSGFEKMVNILNEDVTSLPPFYDKLNKAHDVTHGKSNDGLGVTMGNQNKIDPLRKKQMDVIDNNTTLYIDQDVSLMRPKDVNILYNDMTKKNSYFPHPDNPNLQDDGISGRQQNEGLGKTTSVTRDRKYDTNYDGRADVDDFEIDKSTAFTSNTIKNWDNSDSNLELNTIKTGKMDNANLKTENMNNMGGRPANGSIKTLEQIKQYRESVGGRKLTKEEIPMLGGDALYAVAMSRANRILPMGWDGLSDVNSMWDYIRPNGGMTSEQLTTAVKKAINVRLKEEGYTLKDLGLAEEIQPVENNGGDNKYEVKREDGHYVVYNTRHKPDETPRPDDYFETYDDAAEHKWALNNNKPSPFDNIKEDNLANKAVQNDEFFEITTPVNSSDARMFTQIINQGIDSHLEGFTKSKFSRKIDSNGARLVLNFHKSELPILLRRLEELGSEEAENWKYDIENYRDDDPEMNYLNEKAVSKSQQRFMGMVRGVQKGTVSPDKVGGSVAKAAEKMKPTDVKDFASTKAANLPNKVNNIKETIQSMIDTKEDSMANKPTPIGSQSQGMEMGMSSSMNESVRLLEEINNELNAFSIHQEKLKKMNEDKKTTSMILKDRLGKDNQANFKKDLSVSGTKNIIDIEKELQWKDQQTEIGKDAQKLSKDLEKKALNPKGKITPKSGYESITSSSDDMPKINPKPTGEAFKNVGDSTNEKGDEIPKRNMSGDEVKAVDMYRLGMSDLVYDNLTGQRFEDRMKNDMGDDIYKQRQEKMKFRGDAPLYNKDTQPTEKGDESLQYEKGWDGKKGLKESMVTGRYYDNNGKSHMVDFMIVEATISKEKGENWSSISFDGLGNSYANKLNVSTRKVDINEGVVDTLGIFKFYIDENQAIHAVKCSNTLNENIGEKKVANTENLDKMKHLLGYKPNSFVDNKNNIANRGF